MPKSVILKIINASFVEAYEFDGIKIGRGFDDQVELPMEKANRLVAALGNVGDITISVVPDSLNDQPNGYGQAELAAAKELAETLQAEVVALTGKVNDQQSVIEAQATKIAELEALVEAQKQPVQEKVEEKAEVKTADVAAPAKAAPKKAAK